MLWSPHICIKPIYLHIFLLWALGWYETCDQLSRHATLKHNNLSPLAALTFERNQIQKAGWFATLAA